MQFVADPSQGGDEEIRGIDIRLECLELIHIINASWVEYLIHFLSYLLSRGKRDVQIVICIPRMHAFVQWVCLIRHPCLDLLHSLINNVKLV